MWGPDWTPRSSLSALPALLLQIGYQVEFSYPPLIPGDGHDSPTIPEEWKYLPFLALPDGAHNYQEDVLDAKYFVNEMPGDGHDSPTIPEEWKYLPFLALPDGAHNYQEVCLASSDDQADKPDIRGAQSLREGLEFPLKEALKVRHADVTRETVQKSVCVLSKLVLILFKLILLEKKVLFYISPVNKLVGALMTVLSLFPGMIEHGLRDCSQYKPRKSMSEDAGLQENTPPADDFVSVSAPNIAYTNSETVQKIPTGNHVGDAAITMEEPLFPVEDSSKGQGLGETSPYLKPPSRPSPESSESDWETLDPSVLEEPTLKERDQVGSEQTNSFPRESVPSDSAPITVQPQASMGQVVLLPGLISGLEEDQYGMPLAIFTKGYLCLPYMALQQHHLLSDVTVRGFVAGATNILFRQQKHLSDAIVEVEEALIQVQDPELRRLLSPTTADLRFADYLVKHVTENRDDVFLDGTGWEGGDEWIRAQFAVYIHALLAATLQLDNEKVLADYGTAFVMAWKNTHNYRVWNSNRHPALAEINPNHPFQGQYSVSDMKLRFSHSVQNSERGKKIGNVMVTTSRNVVQTGKAVGQSVGGALSSAKTAMSSWLSTFTSSTPHSLPEPPSGKP
ncbi:Late secretory pathway protein AVL9 like protein [Myotis davidii]|uniref:Late secretory pathway protein AVL9 like protein n=1 Tax=Myotis davidii TaxID=225400 RepID=L5MA76_MYODS|nr:Late secretory pathway protein AVL9 like protein [Myotis davidii]